MMSSVATHGGLAMAPPRQATAGQGGEQQTAGRGSGKVACETVELQATQDTWDLAASAHGLVSNSVESSPVRPCVFGCSPADA